MLQSVWLRRVGHDLTSEQQQNPKHWIQCELWALLLTVVQISTLETRPLGCKQQAPTLASWSRKATSMMMIMDHGWGRLCMDRNQGTCGEAGHASHGKWVAKLMLGNWPQPPSVLPYALPDRSLGEGESVCGNKLPPTSGFCVCVCWVTKSCPTLCDPMDCSPPGSSDHGTFQARVLTWVDISSSRGSSWPRDWTHVSCISCIGRWIVYQLHHLGSPN